VHIPRSTVLLWVAGSVACAKELPQPRRSADDTYPANVVARQADAYNRRDLDAFVATYSPNIEMRTLGSDSVEVRGHQALREAYKFLLTAPKEFHAATVERVVSGPFVVDREHLEGLPQPLTFDPVVIYEVRDSLIRRVWFTPSN
jgi:hypothetical protein